MKTKAGVKLISCNIEGRKHFERLLPFLISQEADVVCVQEVFEVDLEMMATQLGMQFSFTPMLNSNFINSFDIEDAGLFGLAIFSKLPIQATNERFYVGDRKEIPILDEKNNNCLNRAVLWMDVEKDGQQFRIATTHFTWASGGGYIPLQGENLTALEKILHQELGEFVLCGDFNAPRGGVVYQQLTSWLTDNIPADVTTSIDGNWHKAGNLQLMVDYLFSTQSYQVDMVGVHQGVSDHMAVSGLIKKPR